MAIVPPAPSNQILAPKPAYQEWASVLRDVGYPTKCIVVDFETYFDSEYSMKKLSTIEYIMDRRWEVLGCAFKGGEGPAKFEIGEAGTESALRAIPWDDFTIIMQNAKFDASILAYRYGIYPKYVIDILGLARYWNSRQRNGLEYLAPKLGLQAKGETAQFAGSSFRPRYYKPKGRGNKAPKQYPPMTAEKIDQLSEYARNDTELEWSAFKILLPRLSNPKIELRLMQHTLELYTRPNLRLDMEEGKRIVAGMDAEAAKAIPVGMTAKELTGDISFERELVSRLEAAGDNPTQYYKIGLKGFILAIAKPDNARAKLLSHPNTRVRELMQARIDAEAWPSHKSRVQGMMAQAVACGGNLPIALKYAGAHTGRWSGDEGINPQNWPKQGHELLVAIRGMVIPPPDHSLVIVDASQIEARVLAWVAGDEPLVKQFANNDEIYCGFATKVLGWRVRKPQEGGIKAIEDRHKWARNSIGKIGILGCGYGMGPRNPDDRDKPNYLFEAAGLTTEIADKIVATYRQEHQPIVKFWKDIERAFSYTARYHKSCSLPRGLRFDWSPICDVILTLPNGRETYYHKVRLSEGKFSDKIEVWNDLNKSWEYTWGGSLAENIVQAISRDILAEAMLRIEDQGWHTALTCHDELVLIAEHGNAAERCLNAAIGEMSLTPDWALGCPLSSEGKISERYTK